MRRVLFVLPALGIGGAEKSLIELLNAIDYSKYKVTLLLLKGHGEFFQFVNKNVEVIDLDKESSFYFQNIGLSFPYFFKKRKLLTCIRIVANSLLHRLPNSLRPNMSHLVWSQICSKISTFNKDFDIAIGYLQGISEYFVADKVKAEKKIFWMHTCFGAHSKNDEFELSYIKKFDKIVCVSKAAKDDFVKLFPFAKDNTVVFYNIINKKEIEKKSEEDSIIVFNKSEINIVSVGRLHPCKGYDVALKAISKLVNKFPNIHYYIVGGGVEKKNIERIISKLNISDYCTLLGAQPNPYKYLKQADILLQSSIYEGFCIALSESLALGKPVITTDFFGAKEQVVDGKNGLIVQCNHEDIYNALYRIVTDKDLFFELKQNASAWNNCRDIKKEFSNIVD